MEIDPRVSLISLGALFLLLIISNSLLFLFCIVLLFSLLVAWISSVRRFIRISSILLIPTVMIIGLNWFFVSKEGSYLILTSLRFWSLSWVFNWYLIQTTPDDLAQALWSLHVPYKVAWQISLAYRYLPMFQNESQRIYQSQIARGIPIDQSYKQKLLFLPSLTIPLLVMTQEKAMLFGEALYARNWSAQTAKTVIHPLHLTVRDWGILFLLICLILAETFF
ncbi:MAG: energy-coupling factor transporter transmembrane protein EcfT [Candidatus Heimdallarchaeota archaeon]|nr:energy-coupling factor transporter transmembrane protein EcfT [Candidatus Heimdallarchaeota archaeon]